MVYVVLFLGVGATLFTLGVRDWRCYPLALLWPGVHTAVQAGNVTIVIVLAAALVWRFRDRQPVAGLSVGISMACKFVLWQLGAWLVATGRRSAAAWSAASFLAVFLGSWAIVGISDLVEYPSRLRYLEQEYARDGYSLDGLASELGVSASVGRAAMFGVATALLVAVVVVARRGDDMRGFILAIAAALAFSPIVWLHYFAFLLVPIALVRPRLSLLWFLPLATYLARLADVGTAVETTVVIFVAVVVIILAYRAAPAALRVLRGMEMTATGPMPAR